jgi:hypothetical protein
VALTSGLALSANRDWLARTVDIANARVADDPPPTR